MADIGCSLSVNREYSARIVSAENWPENLVGAAGLVVFFLVWSFHGAVVEADRSLHHDVLEAYAWGKEFQLGYHQHGPFWAWIAGAWFYVFPNTNTSFVLLEALNAALGLLGAWQLIGLFVQGKTRHAATVLLLATPFYTFLAYRYNANTILISLWPWTLYYFVKSIDCMKLKDALIFGLLAAAAILSKYYAVILLLTCAFSLLFHPNARRYILSPLPWAAAAVFSVAVLPHLIWSLKSGAPPVAYAVSLTGKSWLITTRRAIEFFTAVAAYHVLVAGIIFAARLNSRPCQEQAVLPPPRQRFLSVLALLPVFLTVVFGLAFRLKFSPVMAMGTFPLMPLFLMQFAKGLDAGRCFRLALAVAVAISFGAATGAPIERYIVGQKSNGWDMIEPRRELAERVTELWRAETGLPLRYAGASVRYANAIAFYSKDRPSSFPDLEFGKAGWLTPEKLKEHGLLIACVHTDVACLNRATPFVSENSKQFAINLSRRIGSRQIPKTAFDIFIVPPQANAALPQHAANRPSEG
jgi:Dolichyl-phosphate-mannose-protein mannosyltransferase